MDSEARESATPVARPTFVRHVASDGSEFVTMTPESATAHREQMAAMYARNQAVRASARSCSPPAVDRAALQEEYDSLATGAEQRVKEDESHGFSSETITAQRLHAAEFRHVAEALRDADAFDWLDACGFEVRQAGEAYHTQGTAEGVDVDAFYQVVELNQDCEVVRVIARGETSRAAVRAARVRSLMGGGNGTLSENREKYLRATLTPIVHDAMRRAQVRVQMPDLPDSRPFVDAIVRLFADALRDAGRLDRVERMLQNDESVDDFWKRSRATDNLRESIDAATLTTERRNHE